MAKTISASVGQGGSNVRSDVATVQYLLNCVHSAQGGPLEELVIDGLIGPLTIGAIYRFQKSRFSFSDGRVDPGGKTLGELHRYDPYPDSGPVTPVGGAGKGGGKGSGGKDAGGYGKSGGGKTGIYAYGGKGGAPGYGGKSGGSKTPAYGYGGKSGGKSESYGGTGKSGAVGYKLPGKFWEPMPEGKSPGGKTGGKTGGKSF